MTRQKKCFVNILFKYWLQIQTEINAVVQEMGVI